MTKYIVALVFLVAFLLAPAGTARAALNGMGQPRVRWPAGDVVRVSDLCLSCGDWDRAPHPHGSQWV